MPQTALVVEDDEMLADLLGQVLRQMGFHPSILHEGSSAPTGCASISPTSSCLT